jgi:uncharacterized protein (TIGR03435 family)
MPSCPGERRRGGPRIVGVLGIDVHTGGVQAFVAKPKSNHCDFDSGLEKVHRRGVANDARTTPGWSGELEDRPELGIWASAYQAMEPLPDLAAALQSQLGLKLQSKKAPVEVLMVDHVEKAPTVN